MPDIIGSTTFSVAATATAASNALPPARRMSTPACEASRCALLTIPLADAPRAISGAAAKESKSRRFMVAPSLVVLHQRENVVAVQFAAAVQKRQLDHESE